MERRLRLGVGGFDLLKLLVADGNLAHGAVAHAVFFGHGERRSTPFQIGLRLAKRENEAVAVDPEQDVAFADAIIVAN